MSSSVNLIELVEATINYPQSGTAITALHNINLRIEAGQKIAIVGANGSGKSSLLKVLAGLINSNQSRSGAHSSTKVAMLFQQPYMLNTSALNNVALASWLRGTPWAQAKVLAAGALEKVDLLTLASRNAKQLSGGQKQRVGVARALVVAPSLLLLDEPTASLDPSAKKDLENLIADLAQNPEITLVFASHNLGQVKRLADRVLFLEDGNLKADLHVEKFFDDGYIQKNAPEAANFLKGRE